MPWGNLRSNLLSSVAVLGASVRKPMCDQIQLQRSWPGTTPKPHVQFLHLPALLLLTIKSSAYNCASTKYLSDFRISRSEQAQSVLAEPLAAALSSNPQFPRTSQTP